MGSNVLRKNVIVSKGGENTHSFCIGCH